MDGDRPTKQQLCFNQGPSYHRLKEQNPKSKWTLTSNCQITEEKPPGDEGLLGIPRWFVHDVQIRRVEAQRCGRESVRYKVYPQQLDRN